MTKKIEPILFKATLSDKHEPSNLVNVDFTKGGQLTKRKGWKTFDEMVYVLLDLNKRYKKLGYQGEFTVRLPLNRSRGKKRINQLLESHETKHNEQTIK